MKRLWKAKKQMTAFGATPKCPPFYYSNPLVTFNTYEPHMLAKSTPRCQLDRLATSESVKPILLILLNRCRFSFGQRPAA